MKYKVTVTFYTNETDENVFEYKYLAEDFYNTVTSEYFKKYVKSAKLEKISWQITLNNATI